jgi:hypothetical protein
MLAFRSVTLIERERENLQNIGLLLNVWGNSKEGTKV